MAEFTPNYICYVNEKMKKEKRKKRKKREKRKEPYPI